MIELTEQQAQALENPEATPPRVVNPRTRETFVLLRVEEYERLKEEAYDDSPWTREELQALAWERIGIRLWPAFAGVMIVEAIKQVYAGVRVPVKKPAFAPVPALTGLSPARRGP